MIPVPAIDDYGIIGDCRSAALISKSGSLDWLCWPTFSASPVFSRLLDSDGSGMWSITPRHEYTSTHRYVGATNVLETTFHTATGSLTLTDFMPVASEEYRCNHLTAEHQITRILACEKGSVDLVLNFAPRNGFERVRPIILDKGRLGLRVEGKEGALTLQSDLNWHNDTAGVRAAVSLRAGECRNLILTYTCEGPAVLPPLNNAPADLERTLAWWEEWSSKFSYTGAYKSAVQRSALVLKLLQFSPSGAFVAAATTSLPEKLGGKLNWDYRYCWLRDASFNVSALCGTGYGDEAKAFMEWMLQATRLTQPKLMIVYDLFGNPCPPEKEITNVSGYRSSRPVRTGNLAAKQHQLDTYGEVICGAAQIIKGKGLADRETQSVLVNFGKYVVKHWKEPDAGIWESRGTSCVHTHSRLLCWVALDELLKIHASGAIAKMPVELFRRTRDEIRADLETNSWNEQQETYTSRPHSVEIDATLLLIAMHNFESSNSHRLQATFSKVKQALYAGDGLIYRNRNDDGQPVEGAFGICGFWVTEFLAMGGGTLEAAQENFETILRYANALGLFAEEIDPASGKLLGNFPQTFTHVGLINAALAIEKRAHPPTETPS